MKPSISASKIGMSKPLFFKALFGAGVIGQTRTRPVSWLYP